MKTSKWKIEPFDEDIEKDFKITNSDVDLEITIDYDDVIHKIVDEQAKKLVKILNKHWFEYNI